MTDKERALKVLRYLAKHVEIKTECGWYLEGDKRGVDKDNLILKFKYVVDHHQA